jgi:hypothetical protein
VPVFGDEDRMQCRWRFATFRSFFVKSNLIACVAGPPNEAWPRGSITTSLTPGTPNGDRAALVSEVRPAVEFCRQRFLRTSHLILVRLRLSSQPDRYL